MTTRLSVSLASNVWTTVHNAVVTNALEFTSPTGILQIKIDPQTNGAQSLLGGKLTELVDHPNGHVLELTSQWIKTGTWVLYSPNLDFYLTSKFKLDLNSRLGACNVQILGYTLAKVDQFDSLNELLNIRLNGLDTTVSNSSQLIDSMNNELQFIRNISLVQLDSKMDQVVEDINATLQYDITQSKLALEAKLDEIKLVIDDIYAIVNQ